jgi:hypothetical protein
MTAFAKVKTNLHESPNAIQESPFSKREKSIQESPLFVKNQPTRKLSKSHYDECPEVHEVPDNELVGPFED